MTFQCQDQDNCNGEPICTWWLLLLSRRLTLSGKCKEKYRRRDTACFFRSWDNTSPGFCYIFGWCKHLHRDNPFAGKYSLLWPVYLALKRKKNNNHILHVIFSDAEVQFGSVLWGFLWTWNWTYGLVQANVWTLDQTIGSGPVQVWTCLNL